MEAKNEQTVESVFHTNDMLVSARNLVKKYKVGNSSITALDNVNLDIKEGQLITIQGRSGCGKSTLLNMISLMDNPTSGTITILGKDITSMNSDQQAILRAKYIGRVFQFFYLIDHYTALENVAIAIGAAGERSDKKRKELAREILKKLGLESRLDNKPEELSGGEQQRVAIARALVNDPKMIVADEPTGNLDVNTGQSILDLLVNFNTNEKRTVIIVTHDPNIGSLGKRQITMCDYKITNDKEV